MDIDASTRAIFQDAKKRRSWVIYQLQLSGQSLASLAQIHGVTRQCLYHAFTTPYPHMEGVLAHAVGLKPEVLFAERYGGDGRPARRMGRPRKVSCHDKNNNPNRSSDVIGYGPDAGA